MKSAYSTNIKERRDHSTVICDCKGRLITQADESLPIHIASMTGLMRHLLQNFAGDIDEGDVFISNDPHVAGGTHLPDINMAVPVFHQRTLVAFMCNIAHHADVGGMVPGSMAGGMSEIYQEGLRLPVIKLFRKGKLQAGSAQSHSPQCPRSATSAGVTTSRRLQLAGSASGACAKFLTTYGAPIILAAFNEIVERTSKRMRAAVATIPEGTYSFSDVMDDDGMGTRDIPISVRIDVTGGRIRLDFAGTSKQVTGNINVTLNATQAAVCYTLKALLDPGVPNNQGMLDLPEILVEPGSLLNACFPAPVAARANTCQRIVDVVIGALAEALPEQVVGAANGANTTAVFSGVDPRSNSQYVYLETLGGGFGGRATKDGTDGVQVHITNTSNLPVESIEMEYPLRVESYSLIEDSGGPGRFRGGMGLRRAIRPVGHDCTFNGAIERSAHEPWGVFGGGRGAPGRFMHGTQDGTLTVLPTKPSGVLVREAQTIIIESPGAGGYGPPQERSQVAIEKDQLNGKFSEAYADRHYGLPRAAE